MSVSQVSSQCFSQLAGFCISQSQPAVSQAVACHLETAQLSTIEHEHRAITTAQPFLCVHSMPLTQSTLSTCTNAVAAHLLHRYLHARPLTGWGDVLVRRRQQRPVAQSSIRVLIYQHSSARLLHSLKRSALYTHSITRSFARCLAPQEREYLSATHSLSRC